MKLRSSMQRYGADRDGLSDLVAAARARQLDPVGYLLHPPLRGTGGDAVALEQVEAWLPALDPALPVSISHLTTGAIEQLAVDHPEHRFELRLGTALWHGDKSALHLAADVLDVHAVTPGSSVGYHGVRVVDGGIIAMIGAGSAHGIAPLPDGRSPFHHRRRRLALLEAPHMHTSMVLVDRDVEPPQIGDWVDVQRPLISTWADQVVHR
jgi:alanine racemase